jgi:hypothetical protein
MIHNVEQNTPEWDALRLGKFTASSFKDLFAAKTTATYNNLIKRVAFERLTGESPENFTNDYMQRGHELEPFARIAYEEYTFTAVTNGGFFELDEWTGCSPDGVTGNGIIEIKCPSYATMIDYLCDPKLPSIYVQQVQGQLWITGALWCDFVAYHPKLPFICIRIERDEKMIKAIADKVAEAVKEAKEIIEKVKSFKNQ